MWEALPRRPSAPSDLVGGVLKTRSVSGPIVFDDNEGHVVVGCRELVDISYKIVHWTNLLDPWSCDLEPEAPFTPDSQNVFKVPVWNGLIGKFLGDKVAVA